MAHGRRDAREQGFIDALAQVFHDPDAAKEFLSRTGFPRDRLPEFKNSHLFWHRVTEEIRDGRLVGGLGTLSDAAVTEYPGNVAFAEYQAHHSSHLHFGEERDVVAPDDFRRASPTPLYESSARRVATEMFNQVVDSAPEDWCCLVIHGLTGTGKSVLVDHLRRSRPEPSAKITLNPYMNSTQLLRQICHQLGGHALEEAFKQKVAPHDLLEFVKGRTSPSWETGSRTLSIEDQRVIASVLSSHRVDMLVKTLMEHRCERWLLFIDGAEHLRERGLDRMLLGQLVPQLRRSFPDVRVIFAGQAVLLGGFSEQEVRRIKLEPLARRETHAVLQSIGIEDEQLADRVYAQTGGLPNRIASYSVLETDPDIDLEELEGLERVRWQARVHDKLIARLTDPGLRDAAPGLALLDFFDLGLVETIFERTISREQFGELLENHFIKQIAPDRWRCHDGIRDELGERLSAENPDRCREIHRRAFNAYGARISDLERQTGKYWFDGRVELAIPCLRHVSNFDAQRTHEFFEDELVWATLSLDGEYLLTLRRICCEIPQLNESEAHQLAVALERTTLASVAMRAAAAKPSAYEELAQATTQRAPAWALAQLYSLASLAASAGKDHTRAIEAAKQAVTLDPDDDELWLELATAQGAAQQPQHAEKSIAQHRQRFGDSPEVLVAEANVAFQSKDTSRARAILKNAISAYPDAAAPRLALARQIRKEGDSTTALELVKSVLSREPDNTLALLLQLVLLSAAGDRTAMLDAAGRTPATVATALNAAMMDLRRLDDPTARLAVLADLEERPETVSQATLLALGDRLVAEGSLEQLRKIGRACLRIYPELQSSWTQLEAMILAKQERTSEALAMLEGLKPSEMLLFTPVVLAGCYMRQQRIDNARATLEAWRDAHPGLRDEATLHLACIEDDPRRGLRILGKERGPRARYGRALLLNQLGNTTDAIAELESLVYSDALYDVPRVHALETWLLLVGLLKKQGANSEVRVQLEQMLNLYPHEPSVIDCAAAVFVEEGEFEKVDRITRTWVRSGPICAMKRISVLAEAVLVKAPRAEDILNLLRADPNRHELIVALERATSTLPASDCIDIYMTTMELAPVTLFEVEDLGNQVLMELSETERRERVDTYDREQGVLDHGCSALKIAVYDGRIEEARELAATLRGRFPEMVGVIEWSEIAGLIVAGRNDLVAARIAQLADPTARLDPSRIILLSIAISRTGSPADVISFHQRVANEFEHTRMMCLIRIADAQLRQGEYEQTLTTVDELEELKPKSADTGETLRIRALIGLGKLDDAMHAIERMLACARTGSRAETTAYKLRGDCLILQARYPQAEAAFRQALDTRPRHIGARLGLSRCHELQGRWEKAYDALLVVLAEAPELREKLSSEVRRLGTHVWSTTLTQPNDSWSKNGEERSPP